MTKEAQSEAPSVDDLVRTLVTRTTPNKYIRENFVQYHDEIDKVVAKINRLIVEAELKGFDTAFDCHDYDRLREYRQELSNNLSKGDVDG